MAPAVEPEQPEFDTDPPIPTYEEAVQAGASVSHSALEVDAARARCESTSLLNVRHSLGSRARRGPGAAGGYRRPTVESDGDDDNDDDDNDHGWDLDDLESGSEGDDDDATAHVRREMQEMEIDDSATTDSRQSLSSWGKRIAGLSLSMPWRMSGWRRWSLPGLRIRSRDRAATAAPPPLPPLPTSADNGRNDASGSISASTRPTLRHRLVAALPGLNNTASMLLVGRLLAMVIVLGLLYLLFVSDLFTNMSRRLGSQMFDPESVRMHVQGAVDANMMRETVRHFTSYAHLAGTEGDYALASDTVRLFDEYGLEDVTVDEYYVYLNYPKADGRLVQILGGGEDGSEAIWSAKLKEEGAKTAARENTMVFHGHSKSGDVKGRLMYVNYGSLADFKVLYDSGIDTRGAIALVRQHGTQPDVGLKVRAAEEAGFVGCIIYNDPADDGFLRGETAPNGPFMPADAVERSSVSISSLVLGDVLTPGWASKKGLPRLRPDESPALPKIPSIPISWQDAQVLLQHLQGCGQPAPSPWTGGVPDIGGEGSWWIGDLKTSPVVRLKNDQDENEKQPIWNVYGRINGVEQAEKKIMIGNHRDAWTEGAAGPHSGTAVMMEVARILGELVKRGWRPLRTIEFMSWDGSGYNMIGSTEYVEQNEEVLKKDALAYINLAAAVSGGQTLRAAGSPLVRRLLLTVLNRVGDPNKEASLRDLWDARGGTLERLAASSDYAAFQGMVGTTSLDLWFEGPELGYPARSGYETFSWMEQVGDPAFTYHTLLAQVVGLLVLELADRPVLPLDVIAYGDSLTNYVAELQSWSEDKGANQAGNVPFDLSPLRDAATFAAAALRDFAKWEASWQANVMTGSGWEPAGLGKRRCDYNDRMARFETNLLDPRGLTNRTQFRHVVFAPRLSDASAAETFPGIRDAVIAGDWALANFTVHRVADIVRRAAEGLAE